MKLKQLREHRNAKAKDAHDLNAKYPDPTRRMTAEDASKLDALLGEIEAIDGDIKREERLAAAALAENPQAQHEAALSAATRDPATHGPDSAALRAYMIGGLQNLSAEQVSAMRARQRGDSGAAWNQGIQAAMSTTTPAEGGYTTAPEYQRTLMEAMKEYGGMRSVATILRTATGTEMNFPTANATTEKGEIVGQNATVARQDTTFGNVTLSVYKYSSKDIALPFELLQDSFIDIEVYIQSVLASRIGRITNEHYTVGNGTGQPHGIVVGSTAGKVGTTGQTVTVTHDDLIDLEHSVDPAYRARGSYMFHDDILKVLRKLKDGQNRPIFVPGYETGNPGGAPDRLLGRRFTINQDMPVPAANAKSILFGDLSKYIIRDVMDLTVFRMADSAFIRNGQIGFLAFMRSGGRVVDVGGAVKHYAHSAT